METTAEEIGSKYDLLNKLLPEVITVIEEEQTKAGTHLYNSIKTLHKNLQEAVPSAKKIARFAGQYDYSEHIKGNGYRCYVKVFMQAVHCTIQECKEIRDKRHLLPLNNALHARTIESWSRVFAAFTRIFSILVNIQMNSQVGGLIPTHNEQLKLLQILDSSNKLDVTAFHGHIAGFNFIPSARMFMSGFCLLLASFSEMSNVNHGYIPAFVNVLKFLLDKEARAKRVVALASQGRFSFFTELLSLADSWLVDHFCFLTQPSLSVNIQMSLPPVNLELPTQDGGFLKITPPSSHLNLRPVNCRILCSRRREGMMGDCKNEAYSKPSKGLIVYYHGGGFVATASKNYDVFLKHWAIKLDVPIFCVDYNLAPEAKYPRQLEECFYAYCWALENANLLGTTAEKICFSGDSAGGNLAMGVALKCIQHGVRLPSGLFLAYAAFIVEMTLSPGRLLSLIDPVIPFGFLTKCFKAYLGNTGGGVPKFLEDLVYVDENELKQLGISPDVNALCNKKDTPNKASSSGSTATLTNAVRRVAHALFSYFTRYTSSRSGQRSPSITLESGLVADGVPEARCRSVNRISECEEPLKMTITTSVFGNTVVKDFHDSSMAPDFYLSPFYAPKEFLSQLPKISLITTDLDTCIDDNVVFAKKLTDCGVEVELEIFEGLPHGFLLLAQGSKDARRGSHKAIAEIRSILESDKK